MNSTLLPAAERFAQLIDLDTPPAFLDGGDSRMRPAVSLTAMLRSAAATDPAPLSQSARLAMRERLVALASSAPAPETLPGITARITHSLEQGQQRANGAGRRVGRRMSALVGSVVILTSITGVGVAAARSLPGSPFYDLKRATEAVQLWTTSGQAAKGERHLEFARTRLAEAKRLPVNSPNLAATLRAMNEQTRQANTDLVAAYQASGSVQPLADLVRFARTQYTGLAHLGAALPAQLHQQTSYSALLLTGVTQEVRSITIGVCKKCVASAPTPTSAGTKPAASPTPTASKPSNRATSPSAHPTPSGLIPTHLLPTLPSLLHHHKGQVLPQLSPIPLLSSLAQLLGG
jgi:Domain of unknown function (DUF5667)